MNGGRAKLAEIGKKWKCECPFRFSGEFCEIGRYYVNFPSANVVR